MYAAQSLCAVATEPIAQSPPSAAAAAAAATGGTPGGAA